MTMRMSLVMDITKEAIMETLFKEYLDQQITKWVDILNAQYDDRAERRGDVDGSIIDYSKGYLDSLTHTRSILEEQHEKQ